MPRLSNNEQERYSEIAHRRTRKLIKVVRNHYLISQLVKSFAFFGKRKIHSWLTIMFSKMMKLWMVGIDMEEAQHQKTPEGLGLDSPTHPFYLNFNFKIGFNVKFLIIFIKIVLHNINHEFIFCFQENINMLICKAGLFKSLLYHY